jgi:hypothetical protein
MCYNNIAISVKPVSFFFHQINFRSIIMRKECRALCGLFVVLIVFCVTLPAVSQQSNKDSAVIQYTETVDMSELVKKVDKLSGSIDTLKPLIEDVGDLKVQIARIDERTSNILTIVIGGIVGLFVTIVGGVILQNRSVKKQTPRPIELDQKEQEEQKEYKYQPEGVTS